MLSELGLNFEIIKPEVDEKILPNEKPEELCERLAKIKAQAGIEIIKNSRHEINKNNISQSGINNKNILVIAADTIVVVDNKILGKPHDFNHAVEMLKLLQGREHEVLTGIAVCLNEKNSPCGGEYYKFISGVERTTVKFRHLSDEQINAYAQSGEGLDKAGAYAIQGRGALLIEGINGDYFNVVGLPLCRLGKMLEDFDFFNI